MSVNQYKRNVVYGLGQPLHSVPPQPISSNRAPTTSDRAELLTPWGNKLTKAAWILTAITANSSTWTPTTVNAGATIDTGDLTVTAGDVVVTAGDIDVGAGDLTLTLGSFFVLAGSVGVDLDVGCRTLFATGDEGTGSVSETGFTNVVDTTLSTGAGKVLMKTANPGDSSGWMKIYVGTDIRYIPFWTNLSP